MVRSARDSLPELVGASRHEFYSVGASRHELYWLDWVRFAAAFMVVAIHARGGTWVDWASIEGSDRSAIAAVFFAVTRAGTESVLVFFVLSGYLVGGALIKRVQAGSLRLSDYAVDRASRIFVPLIPALAFSGAVAWWTGRPTSITEFFGTLAGLQGVMIASFASNVPLWSLSYEVWFYVLAGAAAALCAGRPRLAALSFFAVVAALCIFTKLNSTFLFVWCVGALSCQATGSLRGRAIVIVAFVFAICGYIVSQVHTDSVSVKQVTWLQHLPSQSVGHLMLGFGISLLLPSLVAARPRGPFLIIVHDLGAKIAASSYTLYLIHYPVLYLIEYYHPSRYSTFSLESFGWYGGRIVATLFVAFLFYVPFEKRTATVRRWARARIEFYALGHKGLFSETARLDIS